MFFRDGLLYRFLIFLRGITIFYSKRLIRFVFSCFR